MNVRPHGDSLRKRRESYTTAKGRSTRYRRSGGRQAVRFICDEGRPRSPGSSPRRTDTPRTRLCVAMFRIDHQAQTARRSLSNPYSARSRQADALRKSRRRALPRLERPGEGTPCVAAESTTGAIVLGQARPFPDLKYQRDLRRLQPPSFAPGPGGPRYCTLKPTVQPNASKGRADTAAPAIADPGPGRPAPGAWPPSAPGRGSCAGGGGQRACGHRRYARRAVEQPPESDKPMTWTAHGRQIGRRDLVVRRIALRPIVRLGRPPPAATLADSAGAREGLLPSPPIPRTVDDAVLARDERLQARQSGRDVST